MRFTWNCDKKPFERINKEDIFWIKYDYDTGEKQEELLDYSKTYKLCVKLFIATGRDGYTALLNPVKWILDEESAISTF